jgi:hypothetical protein
MPKRDVKPDPLTSFAQRGMAAQKAADDIIAAETPKQQSELSRFQQKAYNAGWNLGEMAGGAPFDPALNPYTETSRLHEAFNAGWRDGQADWLENNSR